jgi:hypothetical protein
MTKSILIIALLAIISAQAQEVGGGYATTDLQEVQPPSNTADTYSAARVLKEYTPEEYAASRLQAPTLHLPTLDNLGRTWTGRFPLFRPGWSTWDLHKGLNVNLGASVFASFGKHAPHGAGFGQSLSAMYAMPLTDKLSVAIGGYFNNIYWAHDAHRSAGLSAVIGYQFDEHWEAFLYGQKSFIHDRFTPYPLYDIGDLGDRIGAAVRYNVNPSFSVELSVEHGSMPHHDSLHDTYMKMPGVRK